MLTFCQPPSALTAWALPLISLLSTALSAFPLEEVNTAYQPRPYTVSFDPALIEEARIKASTFRPSTDTNAPAWFDGPPSSEIASIATFWADGYNWTTVQAEINANFSHFYTTVPPPGNGYDGPVDLHFIHQRSARDDAIPILFLHGWPSTSLEWQTIIPGLVGPDNASQPAFHVVAPDIPGFGFSPALSGSRVDIGRKTYSAIFAALMQQLGYDRYVLYSTDLGAVIGISMVVDYSARIVNHVTDFLPVFPTAEDQARFAANTTSPEESAYIASSNAFFGPHSAYSAIHSTYPLSIAYALNDSPMGFLAWMYQLAATVSDKAYSAQDLVTDTLMLYIPGVYSNIRSYKELFSMEALTPDEKFTVPTSVLQFGGSGLVYPEIADANYVPRAWVERTTNVTYFKRHAAGGHFPALSEPELVLGDLRSIFA